MNDVMLAYGSIILGTLINGFAALLLKRGAKDFKLRALLHNRFVISGFCLYLFSTAFFVSAMKSLPLSIVYPLSSLSYVWVVVLSCFALGEHVGMNKWIGLTIILLGIMLLSNW